MTAPACFYFPLEPVESRYTHQLCNEKDGWMPNALRTQRWSAFHYVNPIIQETTKDVVVGAVLDAATRSRYALAQVQTFIGLISNGTVRDGDVLYFQDFWTPGIEAIYYTLHLYGLKVRTYAMLHAQSVDPHDFTYDMRHWMRGIELGYAREMSGIFVASTCHKEELRQAGFFCDKIHVVGLPFGKLEFMRELARRFDFTKQHSKKKQVVFSSRLDAEKQPQFMVDIAKDFLADHEDYEWVVTTSAKQMRSYNCQQGVRAIRTLAASHRRFKVAEGLTKSAYYSILRDSDIHFNCSLQDYVSWTLIESQAMGCTPVFPNFRSFPECLAGFPRYDPWDKESTLQCLDDATRIHQCDNQLPDLMDKGRMKAAEIAYHDASSEYNIWSTR